VKAKSIYDFLEEEEDKVHSIPEVEVFIAFQQEQKVYYESEVALSVQSQVL
jgi:hypothetical protein